MKVYQFDYFIALAEEKSFTKAAKRLYISQPSLSQYILSVEKELGVELFDRSATPIRPTEAGEQFIQTAYQMMTLQTQLVNRIADCSGRDTGRLTVGLSPFRSACMLPQILRKFRQRWPDVSLSVEQSTVDKFEASARDGKLDFFFSMPQFINKNIFDTELILRERVLLAVPPEDPINASLADCALTAAEIERDCEDVAPERRVPLKLFADKDFVFIAPTQHLYELAMEMCREAGFEPKIYLTSRSMDSIFAMTVAGIGCSFLPHIYMRYGNANRNAAYYCIDSNLDRRELMAAYRKGQYISKPARDFINIAKRLF